MWAVEGSNLRPPACRATARMVSETRPKLTPTPSPVCTTACTSEAENENADALEVPPPGTPSQAPDADQGNEGKGIDQGDSLAKLAAALLTLSPADRVLIGHDACRAQGRGTVVRAADESRECTVSTLGHQKLAPTPDTFALSPVGPPRRGRAIPWRQRPPVRWFGSSGYAVRRSQSRRGTSPAQPAKQRQLSQIRSAGSVGGPRLLPT